MDAIRQNLVAVLQPLVSRMADKRVLFTRDPMALKAWGVLEVRQWGRVERTRRHSCESYQSVLFLPPICHGDVASTGFFGTEARKEG